MSDEEKGALHGGSLSHIRRNVDRIWKWAQSNRGDDRVNRALVRIEVKVDAIVEAMTHGATPAQLKALTDLHDRISQQTDELSREIEDASDKPTK